MGLRAELEELRPSSRSRSSRWRRSSARLSGRASCRRSWTPRSSTRSTRDGMDAMQSELAARGPSWKTPGRARALRSEEQRAAELTDEVRSTKAEVESLRASHRAELVEREAELEAQVRAVREEFQAQLADAESRHAAELAEARAELAARAADAARGEEEASARVAAVGADLEAARSGVRGARRRSRERSHGAPGRPRPDRDVAAGARRAGSGVRSRHGGRSERQRGAEALAVELEELRIAARETRDAP